MRSGWNSFMKQSASRGNVAFSHRGGRYEGRYHTAAIHTALTAAQTQGYVYPVIDRTYFRQHRCMLSFLRVCLGWFHYRYKGLGWI